jgi:hypothetical protein
VATRPTPGSIALALLLLAPVADAQVQPDRRLTYDYLLANYALTDLDSGGLEIGGSFNVPTRMHVFFLYQEWDLGPVDRSTLQIGAGYRWRLSPRVDLAAQLAVAETEIERPGPAPDVDEEGIILSGLLRGWATDRLELSGALLFDDSVGGRVDTVVEFGGQYYLQRNFSVGGRIRVDDDETTLFLGGRFNFGRASR